MEMSAKVNSFVVGTPYGFRELAAISLSTIETHWMSAAVNNHLRKKRRATQCEKRITFLGEQGV